MENQSSQNGIMTDERDIRLSTLRTIIPETIFNLTQQINDSNPEETFIAADIGAYKGALTKNFQDSLQDKGVNIQFAAVDPLYERTPRKEGLKLEDLTKVFPMWQQKESNFLLHLIV